ncbi:MAG TPA: amino acid racemase [Candidatus Paceibacterota bacterium]|nr:amino acid racemase [Candidatus Paceibacterota bacterium]
MTYANNAQNKKTIGILGGMGPAASANLYLKIIKTAQKMYGAEQDTDFPPMFIYNLPLSGFDETGFAKPTLVREQLIDGVKKMEKTGSDFVIVACNTVHYFYDDMQKAVKIPIISIVEETAKAVSEDGSKIVGLLSSESTNKLGIYHKILDNHGIKTLSVGEEEQKSLNKIILHVMSGTQGSDDKKSINKIIADLRSRGAESAILGCTELPLAFGQEDTNIKLFDSTQIITDSALKLALGEKA